MVRINLLPVRVSKKKEAGKQQLGLFAVLLVAGLVANGIFHDRRAGELETLERRVAKTRADIAQIDKIIGEVKSIRTQQQQLKEKLDILEKLKQGRTGPVRMLDELAKLTPQKLWLTRLEEKSGKVTFAGSATSVEDVSQFMAALKGSKHFGNVELKRTQAKQDQKASLNTVDFSIDADLQYQAAAPATPNDGAPVKGGG